jgi:ABC-type nickel/cobalt efflux system permease component RcnA
MTQANESHPAVAAVAKTLAAVVAWVASQTAADVEVWVRIVSGLIVGGFAATQWWVLWRDKVRRKNTDEHS